MIMETITSLNWADFIIIGMIGLSILIGLSRGFIREALSLFTWIVAFWVALKFSKFIGDYFVFIKTPSLRMVLAFAILFIVVLIIGALINRLLGEIITYTGLGGTDKLLGAIFGIVRGILLIAVLLLLAELTPVTKDPWWQQSALIPHFQSLVAWLQGFLPAKFDGLNGIT